MPSCIWAEGVSAVQVPAYYVVAEDEASAIATARSCSHESQSHELHHVQQLLQRYEMEGNPIIAAAGRCDTQQPPSSSQASTSKQGASGVWGVTLFINSRDAKRHLRNSSLKTGARFVVPHFMFA